MSISITQASNEWKIPRARIYEKINAGVLSRDNNKGIDPAEMSRVFGKPRTNRKTNGQGKSYEPVHDKSELYEQRISMLETQARDYRERAERAESEKDWLKNQIDKLTDTLKLLEAPRAEKTEPKAPEPTYTPPPQPVRDYSQWEEDRPRKKKGLLSRFF